MLFNLKVTLLVAAISLLSINAVAQNDSYAINPGDVLGIFVWNEDELQSEVIVRPDGYISLPLAGQIAAGGKTASQVKDAIVEALNPFLKDEPTVTVSVINLYGNKVFILGKVNRPGEYPINRPTDVMQALALGGGLNTFASESKITILRRNANGVQEAIKFNYSDVKAGDDLDTNILLRSGDVVVVR